MRRPVKMRMLHLFAAVSLACGSAVAVTPGELLQQGLYAEEIEADFATAVASYEQIVSDPSAPANLVAQSLYRQGMCYLHMQEDAKAEAAFDRLIKDYPGQEKLVEKVRPILDDLKCFDPALLMPPQTLAYLELGSPGRQIETLLGMLKDTPYANPLDALGKMNQGGHQGAGPAMLMSGILNPSMLAEFKKIRGAAVGLLDIGPEGPSVVAILHPGESDALRGILMTAIGMAGTPGEPVEGMNTSAIDGMVSLAYDEKVIIATYPATQLPWCVRQYKRISKDESLASGSKAFVALDKAARQKNAVSLWVNVDDLFTRLAPILDAGNNQIHVGPMQLTSESGKGIDDLMITHTLESSGLGLEAEVHFKEGFPNPLYEMIQTPSVSRDGLAGVPEQAFGLVTFSLAGEGTAQSLQLRQLVQQSAGLELPEGIFDNVEQIALFALPGTSVIPEGMPFRPGLALQCKDSAPVAAWLRSLVQMLAVGMPITIDEADGFVFVALDAEIAETAQKALADKMSVNESGPLSAPATGCLGSARKLVLLNVGGMIRLAAIQAAQETKPEGALAEEFDAAFADLARQFDGATFRIFSDEQPQTLALRASLSGLPPLSRVLGPIEKLDQVNTKAEQQRWAAENAEREQRQKKLLAMPPASVAPCAVAPVIDGEMDAAWNHAESYLLTNTIHGVIESEEALSGSYRMLWDQDNFYMFFEVKDNTPTHDVNQGWQFSDGIELYLDTTDAKPRRYDNTQYEFGFVWNANPEMATLRQEQGPTINDAEFAFHSTEGGYNLEAVFPWNSLGTVPAAGNPIGVEVQVNDNRGHGRRDAKISWHDPYDQSWLNPRYFGRATLKAAVSEQ